MKIGRGYTIWLRSRFQVKELIITTILLQLARFSVDLMHGASLGVPLHDKSAWIWLSLCRVQGDVLRCDGSHVRVGSAIS